MKKILFVLLFFYGAINSVNVFAGNFIFEADSLIEPGKQNPKEPLLPDSVDADTLLLPDPVQMEDSNEMDTIRSNSEIAYAVVELMPTEGNNGSGTLKFSKTDSGIKITGQINGISPGMHGIHIHETGDCSAPDATSAGEHFNPDQMPHAGPQDMKRHTGDLGNIEADQNGTVIIDMLDTKLSFEGMHSIIGKAVVVHSGKDDLTSQPAGDSGSRILCGVIEKSE